MMNQILSYVRRCVEDYDMIQAGDRVAVGVSGGKDSLTLLVALARLSVFYPKPFTVEAFTLDMGHVDGGAGMDFPMWRSCAGNWACPIPCSTQRSTTSYLTSAKRKIPAPCALKCAGRAPQRHPGERDHQDRPGPPF